VAWRRRRLAVKWRSVVFSHPDADRALWVCSWQRSGSTWLAEILSQAPRTRLIYEPANVLDNIITGEESAVVELPRHSQRHARRVARAFEGIVKGPWVDQFNTTHFPTRHVVKDVRAMGILGDVAELSPETPIIVLLRHPFDVARSALRLGWRDANISDEDAFVHEVTTWCELHDDALRDPRSSRALWVTYEDLTGDNAGASFQSVLIYLTTYHPTWRALTSMRLNATQRSQTDFSGEGRSIDLPDSWRERGASILAHYGFDRLYSSAGDQVASTAEFLAQRPR
jgi:hypothetical protein